MARVNTVKLEAAIMQCVDLSMDGHIADGSQDKYLDCATELRKRLVKIKAKEFADGQPDVEKANDLLAETNQRLKEVKTGLDKIADSLKAVGTLVAVLDKIVNVVTSIG